jgi:hypothetical protein
VADESKMDSDERGKYSNAVTKECSNILKNEMGFETQQLVGYNPKSSACEQVVVESGPPSYVRLNGILEVVTFGPNKLPQLSLFDQDMTLKRHIQRRIPNGEMEIYEAYVIGNFRFPPTAEKLGAKHVPAGVVPEEVGENWEVIPRT